MMTYDGDASRKGYASKLPSSYLIPSPYLTFPFNSVSQLVPGILGKVDHISTSTARQNIQMNVD